VTMDSRSKRATGPLRTFFLDLVNCFHHGPVGMVFANEEWILNLGSVVRIVETSKRTQFSLVDRYGIAMEDVLWEKEDAGRVSLRGEY
jgi:hypothetical protein